jgi:hypothetical protein
MNLSKALKFDDPDFVKCFMDSLQNASAEIFPGEKETYRYFYFLVWEIPNVEALDHRPTWKIVRSNWSAEMYNKQVGQKSIPFQSKIQDNKQPKVMAVKGKPNHLQVLPGKHPKSKEDEVCKNIMNFMQDWRKRETEVKALWQHVGKIAYKWLTSNDDKANEKSGTEIFRSEVKKMEKKVLSNGQEPFNPKAVTKTGTNLGQLSINTHGLGVPWLHVRLEGSWEYDKEIKDAVAHFDANYNEEYKTEECEVYKNDTFTKVVMSPPTK